MIYKYLSLTSTEKKKNSDIEKTNLISTALKKGSHLLMNLDWCNFSIVKWNVKKL